MLFIAKRKGDIMDTIFISLCHAAANILSMIIGYIFMRVVDCCLVRRRGKLVYAAGIIGYGIVSTTVIFPQDMYNICFVILLFLLLNSILYKGKWVIKLSLILILFPVFTAVNFLSVDITGKLFFQFYTEEDTLENAFFSNSPYLILILFWLLFSRHFCSPLAKIRDIFTNQAWGIICVVCTAPLIALFSCVYLSPFHDSYFVWPCMAACIVANIGSIQLASYLADGLYANLERKNLQLQQTYYAELEQNQRQIRKLRHDINNHLAVVGQLLSEENFAQAQAYFHEISDYMQVSNRKFCENSVVNAVLNAKYQLLTEAEIDAFFHISIDGMMFIDDVSLCTIFANTLDNAIEACRKISDTSQRRIELKCRYTENGYFNFSLVNSKINDIVIKKGQLLSDKQDRRLHGIGISSVKTIVEKYQGTLDISYDTENFRVVILIGG